MRTARSWLRRYARPRSRRPEADSTHDRPVTALSGPRIRLRPRVDVRSRSSASHRSRGKSTYQDEPPASDGAGRAKRTSRPLHRDRGLRWAPYPRVARRRYPLIAPTARRGEGCGVRSARDDGPRARAMGTSLPLAAQVNSVLTAWAIRRRTRANPEPTVLWLYDPCFAGCIGKSGEQFAVYDCVDDYAEQAAGDRRMRRSSPPTTRSPRGDRDWSSPRPGRSSSATASTMRGLSGAQRRRLPRTLPRRRTILCAGESGALPPPVIGFAGNFLPGKVDFALLEALAARRPEWTVLLVGPRATARRGPRRARVAGRTSTGWARSRTRTSRATSRPSTSRSSRISERVHAELLPAQDLRVPGGRQACRGVRPARARRNGAPCRPGRATPASSPPSRPLARRLAAERRGRQALAAENTWETRRPAARARSRRAEGDAHPRRDRSVVPRRLGGVARVATETARGWAARGSRRHRARAHARRRWPERAIRGARSRSCASCRVAGFPQTMTDPRATRRSASRWLSVISTSSLPILHEARVSSRPLSAARSSTSSMPSAGQRRATCGSTSRTREWLSARAFEGRLRRMTPSLAAQRPRRSWSSRSSAEESLGEPRLRTRETRVRAGWSRHDGVLCPKGARHARELEYRPFDASPLHRRDDSSRAWVSRA